MDNTNYIQKQEKPVILPIISVRQTERTNRQMIFMKTFIFVSFIAVALICSPLSISIVFSEPMDPNYSPENCKSEDKYGYVTCCWKKDGKTYCQACKTDGKTIQCGKVQGPIGLVTGESGPVFQGDDDVLEQPPTTNIPSIKSDNSFPNDDDKVLDEQQLTPDTPSTNQRVPAGNAGTLEQLEDLSMTESTDSEMTTSFAKKGNTQNSPVPPECPKQGPIPPDCTMKPKF